MQKKVSLKDIAQKVGVSTALVSYVLNNRMENRISKEIAGKIRAAAKELDYRPNQIAKSLKTKKTNTIGLIVADISNPFSSSIARYIEDEADKNNYTVIFGSSDEKADKAMNLINVLNNRQVDGFIIAPPENAASQIHFLQEQEIPFVLIDRYYPELNTSYVSIDNYQAAYDATSHLIQTGCKRIGVIAYRTGLHHLQERKRGYYEALKHHKIKPKKEWVKDIRFADGKEGKEEVERSISELLSLSAPADALLFNTNTLSTFGLKYIQSLKIKVPEKLSIVSFDETEASDLFYAPVTYLKQPLQEMGQLATRILLDSIAKNNKTMQVNMQAKLIIRQSTLPLKIKK